MTEEDIKYYYEVSPIIVKNINTVKQKDLIYNYIYNNIVDYCVKQIEKGNYIAAYNRYKSGVLTLEKQFARPVLLQRLVKTIKLSI